MQKVDYILAGGTVVTMDGQWRLLPEGSVAIAADKIVAIGTVGEIAAGYEATEVIDCAGKAIMPGMINAHTHVPMTLLRGLADDLRLDVWLMGYMMPVERQFVTPEFVRLGTLLACAEMIRSGTTCFADMYYFEDEVAAGAAQAGLRAVCAESVLKYPTPDSPSWEDGIAYARRYIEKWKNHPLIVPAVGPHAPYTCPPDVLKACTDLALEYDVPLHIHIAETALEVENSRKSLNMPVVPWVKKQGVLEAKVIAAHCVHIDEGEMNTLAHAGAGIGHCPTSNLKLASGIAPVRQMLEAGVNVGIGTDGPASNNDLDMFEETRLAAILAKGASGDPTALPARDSLALATISSARALHLGDITGSLEVGKRADILVVDLDTTHNSPRFQRDAGAIYSQLVYVAKSSDVRHVFCNGRMLLRDQELLTLNQEQLKRDARVIAREIDQFLIGREGDVVRKLLALGGLRQEESFEIQVKAHLEDLAPVEKLLADPAVRVVKSSRYRQYDTYFFFSLPRQGHLRIREDIYLDDNDRPTPRSRYRLTLIGEGSEREFPHSIILSRSRYTATAEQSLRFYREYLNPSEEREIVKLRRRHRFIFEDTEFAINVDRPQSPSLPGYYIELKSRTWSLRDAEVKAALIGRLLEKLAVDDTLLVSGDYFKLTTR